MEREKGWIKEMKKLGTGMKILAFMLVALLAISGIHLFLPARIVNAEGEGPEASKQLIENGDGTYTLAFSVTGEADTSQEQSVTKANVILVLDTSNSMVQNNTTYNGTTMTRLAAEKHVLTDEDGIIDQLLAQNVAGDENKADIIEVAIANFATRGEIAQEFGEDATNADALKATINELSNTQGTNWQEGLMRAKELADTIKDSQPDEEVYVIFLTDGEPTTHEGDYTVNTNYAQEWAEANGSARALVTAGYHFYALFTWGSGSSSHYLSSLVQYAYTGEGNSNSALDEAYAQYFSDATDTEALIETLNQIVHDITESVGYTNVELEDGVTSMTKSSVKVSAGGEVTGLKYYRSGGTYGEADIENGNYGTEWTDAPKATINDDGEVDWDLGDLILEDGVTYTMTFVVWPSQASYDLVADLNNGVVEYNSLSDDEKAQITENDGHYALKTNLDYPTVTYSTITTTTVDGETTKVVSEPVTQEIKNPDPVGLAESKLNAIKIWEDSLDESQREEIKDVTLYLLVDEEYYYTDAEGEPIGVKLTEASNWTESDYINVAPGLMVTEDSPAYDATKPQVTWEGKTYAIIESGHEYVFEESEINYHYELTAYTHHPMIMGMNSDGTPRVVDVLFAKDASGEITGIESVEDLGDSLSATNILKGGINITKKVVDSSGKEISCTDPFKISVTLTDAEGAALPSKTAEDGTEFTIDYRIYYGENNPNYDASKDENRSEHIYVNGTSFEETLYVGDTIRVVNVEDGAIYNVLEYVPAGYEFVNTTYKIAYEGKNPEDDSEKTVRGNSASYVEITNKSLQSPPPTPPETGDSFRVLPFVLILCGSVLATVGIFALMVWGKKHVQREEE